jgi:hypothetical protein
MEDYINQGHSKTAVIKKNFQPEPELTNGYEQSSSSLSAERPLFGRGHGRQQMTNVPLLNNQSIFSQRLNSLTNSSVKLETSSPPIDENTTKIKEKSLNQTLIIYQYNKPFIDKHLCYLLSPGKQQIIEKHQCQILSCLSVGYCRVRNAALGKEIEKSLYSILPDLLNIDVLKIPDNLQLIICSSAAETVFQQSIFTDRSLFIQIFIVYLDQTHYAIISEPTKIQCKSIHFYYYK